MADLKLRHYQSYWRASLRAPDGTEMAQVFNGEATEAKAWDEARDYFLSTVLPKMLEAGNDDMSVTSYAHGRFTDALLSASSCDEIVLWCDPWELRIEHYPEELLRADDERRALRRLSH